MATLRERLETLPVAELAQLAEVREKLRLNAEEREALEATARKLLEALGMTEEPPPPPPSPTSVVANPMAERVATGNGSYAEMAVWVLNSNLGKDYSASDLVDLWNVRSAMTARTIRSALVKSAARGWIRRVKHGRYTSIYSGRPK